MYDKDKENGKNKKDAGSTKVQHCINNDNPQVPHTYTHTK